MTTTPPRLLAALALTALASGARAAPAGKAEAEPCPCHQAGRPGGVQRVAARYQAPAVELLDQRGKPVDLRQLLSTSRPVALNFIFTSCRTICPVLSASLASLHRTAGSEVDFISVSIDPEYDTPRVLEAYARRFDVGSRWTLLTGTSDAIAAVRRAFDAGSAAKDAHRPLTFLRPAGSQEWIRLDGFPSTSELATGLGLGQAHARR